MPKKVQSKSRNASCQMKNRLIAYLGKKPVGIVDLIITHTVEIDGLGVMEQYRHNAIGSSIQSRR